MNIQFFLKPSPEFRLPKELNQPIVMIGPGTGVSPFRGFLQHLKELNIKKLETWLFYGCRKKDLDFLYKDEFLEFEKNGILKKLIVAASQENTDGFYYSGIYVQDW